MLDNDNDNDNDFTNTNNSNNMNNNNNTTTTNSNTNGLTLPIDFDQLDDSEENTSTENSRNSSFGTNRNFSSGKSLAHEETIAVNRSKRLVYLVLLVAAIVVGTSTYRFVRDEEDHTFRREFRIMARDIVSNVQSNAESKFGQIESLSVAITSYVRNTNQTWPTVLIPDFELKTDLIKGVSGAELIIFAPLVSADKRQVWEEFSTKNQGWIREGLDFLGLNETDPGRVSPRIHPFVDWRGNYLATSQIEWPNLYLPVWQMGSAPVDSTMINGDLLSQPSFSNLVSKVFQHREALLSEITDLAFLFRHTNDLMERANPQSYILQPVYESFADNATIVAFVVAVLPWDRYFQNVLSEGSTGVFVDVKNCGIEFTYIIKGHNGHPAGRGDLHDRKYDHMRIQGKFISPPGGGEGSEVAHHATCHYWFNIYPSRSTEEPYHTSRPIRYTMGILAVFVFTMSIFALYDYTVQRRQYKVMRTATRTNAIVSSLFPKSIHNRMIEEAGSGDEFSEKSFHSTPKHQLRSFLFEDQAEDAHNTVRPIADLFPAVTIMFADIVGFTAWSSTREPSQVFTLLEALYSAFDKIAKRRRVFKVETVGDCYVAVAGLPDPRKDHHVTMARCARDCLHKMNSLTKDLETTLGPDVSDLGLRIGLHSGPVIAGVLRGERARFQLFGDTVNTTSRMESTGERNKIHVSEQTASLLTESGKGHWARPRAEKVTAKGKGELQTYWLHLQTDVDRSMRSECTDGAGSMSENHPLSTGEHKTLVAQFPANETAVDNLLHLAQSQKEQRLIDWNATLLLGFLKGIVARREASGISPGDESTILSLETTYTNGRIFVNNLDEVVEVVKLPKYDAKVAQRQRDPECVDLGENVSQQLRLYVRGICDMYIENPFHNFEHASHVTMSTAKLLSRIVAPDLNYDEDGDCDVARDLHDDTYGITSDPLTQFSVILSALIHDIDHPGVPNAQLVKEQTSLAANYKDKSVAEQNSLDLAWKLLMRDEFKDLRRTIYATASEFKRFRQLVVNSVMATDIMDKDLSNLRKNRWNKAFAEDTSEEHSNHEHIDRKATIVIEHLIQASDVSHTMQHWHVYTKWNERLFAEMLQAYRAGRSTKDPSEFWYQSELGFLDHYVIPLAKKLKDCGVFGVSSDEYLNYAIENRGEWESKGKQFVEAMIDRHVR